MNVTFVETRGFTESVSDFLSDLAYERVQQLLMENPGAGDVMPGCGGPRKLRTADSMRGKGKRGGARLIYLHVPEGRRFYLLDIYGKNEKDDLSADEKKQLRQLAEALKLEAVASQSRRIREDR